MLMSPIKRRVAAGTSSAVSNGSSSSSSNSSSGVGGGGGSGIGGESGRERASRLAAAATVRELDRFDHNRIDSIVRERR